MTESGVCAACGEAANTYMEGLPDGAAAVVAMWLCPSCHASWALSMERARAMAQVADFLDRRHAEVRTR